jgi:hypothetical protein
LQAQRDAVAELARQAKRSGVFPAFVADVGEIDRRLSSDPARWGDPQYHYYHLELLVYHATLQLVHVYYAVDDKRRIVYIQELLAMPNRGLDQ